MGITEFIKIINKQKDQLTLEYLNSKFANQKFWKSEEDAFTLFLSKIQASHHTDEAVTYKASQLKLVGLLWCPGTAQQKTEVLFDIICSKPFILATDKQLHPTLLNLFTYATDSVFNCSSNISLTNEEIESLDDFIFWLEEDFVDQVFDTDSRLNKQEWVQIVSNKFEYIYSPHCIREKIKEYE